MSRLSTGSTDSLVSSQSSDDGTASSTPGSGHRRRKIKVPRLDVADQNEGSGAERKKGTAQSPLISLGLISGDGLMLFITCFASVGVFLFGYDQVRQLHTAASDGICHSSNTPYPLCPATLDLTQNRVSW